MTTTEIRPDTTQLLDEVRRAAFDATYAVMQRWNAAVPHDGSPADLAVAGVANCLDDLVDELREWLTKQVPIYAEEGTRLLVEEYGYPHSGDYPLKFVLDRADAQAQRREDESKEPNPEEQERRDRVTAASTAAIVAAMKVEGYDVDPGEAYVASWCDALVVEIPWQGWEDGEEG